MTKYKLIKKNKWIVIVGIVFILLLVSRSFNWADYLARHVQSSIYNIELMINHDVKIMPPDEWIVSDYYTIKKGPLLYGYIPYSDNQEFFKKVDFYVSLKNINSDEMVDFYQLKDEFHLSYSVYCAKRRVFLLGKYVGYVISDEIDINSIYFPELSLMMTGRSFNLMREFFVEVVAL